jgi:DNA-binding transcriptional ArsR family regulator
VDLWIDRCQYRKVSKQSVAPVSPDTAEVDACCASLDGGALSPEQAARMAPMFKALGDPVRLRLLSLIAASGSEACVCDLTDAFDLSGPTSVAWATCSAACAYPLDGKVLRTARRRAGPSGRWRFARRVVMVVRPGRAQVGEALVKGLGEDVLLGER